MVTPADENHIEQQLRAHEAETSNQIAVLTVPSLEGEIIEEYALKVAETWALGQKDKDNGALIIIARDDRKLRIEVGYGLEGMLTDVYAGRIVRDVMVPQLKAGNPSGAIKLVPMQSWLFWRAIRRCVSSWKHLAPLQESLKSLPGKIF